MDMLDFGHEFATEQLPESGEFDLLPVGDYVAQIIEAQVHDRDEGVKRVVLTWEILEGERTGRRVWHDFQLFGSEKSHLYAEAQMGKLNRAMGVDRVRNPNVWMHKPCIIRVGIQKGTGEYPDVNRVKNVTALELSGSSPRPTATASAAGSGRVPWGNRR